MLLSDVNWFFNIWYYWNYKIPWFLVSVFMIISGYSLQKEKRLNCSFLLIIGGVVNLIYSILAYWVLPVPSWPELTQADYNYIISTAIVNLIIRTTVFGLFFIIISIKNEEHRKYLFISGLFFIAYSILSFINVYIMNTYLLTQSMWDFIESEEILIFILIQEFYLSFFILAITFLFWYSINLQEKFLILCSFSYLALYLIFTAFFHSYFKMYVEIILLFYIIPQLIVKYTERINPDFNINKKHMKYYYIITLTSLFIYSISSTYGLCSNIIPLCGLISTITVVNFLLISVLRVRFPERKNRIRNIGIIVMILCLIVSILGSIFYLMYLDTMCCLMLNIETILGYYYFIILFMTYLVLNYRIA